MQREVFGPVVSVTEFDDEDQCWPWLTIHNMAGLVRLDPDVGRAHRLSARLQYGCTGEYPFYAGKRNATRRHEVIRLWERYVGVRA